MDFGEERARLEKAIAKADKEITALDKRLSNPQYREKAPAHVVEEAEGKLESERAARAKLEAALKRLE